MDTDLAPIDIALHWPFIRRHLLIGRRPSAARALDALATRQLDAGGNPVSFGTRFWRGAGLTPGQIGATTDALLELERRAVVARYPGRGRLGHSWTFVSSVRHWSGMTVPGTGRAVTVAVSGCACRGPRPVVAVIPGQGTALSRSSAVFRLSEADHLHRPGLFPVEDRDYRATPATTGRRPRLFPVEDRDYRAAPGALYLASGDSKESLSLEDLSEEELESFRVLRQVVLEQCRMDLFGRPKAELEEAVRGMTAVEARAVASQCQGITHAASGVQIIRQAILEHRAKAERRETWRTRRIAWIAEHGAGDDHYDAELEELLAGGSGHSPPSGIAPTEERNFEGHPRGIA